MTMTQATYTITVKPAEPKGDLSFYTVDGPTAKEIQQRWDNHQNIQIGDHYISWQRVVEITAPPKDLQLAVKLYCGRCDKGWKYNALGGYACEKCNPRGQELTKEYYQYLESQTYYAEAMRLTILYATPGYWEGIAAINMARREHR